jgi:hypothetical protein
MALTLLVQFTHSEVSGVGYCPTADLLSDRSRRVVLVEVSLWTSKVVKRLTTEDMTGVIQLKVM